MKYQVRTELKPKKLDGISADQIDQHWKLYEGYVKNVNLLVAHAAGLAKKGDYGPEFAEIKRRLGFEYDGMILHEHYFSVLKGGTGGKPGKRLLSLIERDFGTFQAWKAEFTETGKMRGVGWAILYFDPRQGFLSNNWISLHEGGHPAGFVPLLVMDVWEHAYMVDWGAAGRGDYISAFFDNLDWAHVERTLDEHFAKVRA
jgi:Fe-Mn family superoxide dismutase